MPCQAVLSTNKKSVHECTNCGNCGRWTVHSNLSLWSSISTIFCSKSSTHTNAALQNTSPHLLSGNEKRVYSPATPPVSSCANARCLCSHTIQMFQDFSHLKTKGLLGARVHNVIMCSYRGVSYNLKLFTTSHLRSTRRQYQGMTKSAFTARACDALISTPPPASESSFCRSSLGITLTFTCNCFRESSLPLTSAAPS